MQVRLTGKENPVVDFQCLTPQVNNRFPGVALFQYIQLVNEVGRGHIQVFGCGLMKNTRALLALIIVDVCA